MWSRVYFADGAPYLMTTTSYGTRLRAQEADTKIRLFPKCIKGNFARQEQKMRSFPEKGKERRKMVYRN